MEYYNEAEKRIEPLNDCKTLLDIYIKKANVYLFLVDKENMMAFYKKAGKTLTIKSDDGLLLEYKLLKSNILIDENKLEEATEMLIDIIQKCGTNFIKTKGHAYRRLSFIYIQSNKHEIALQYLHQSVEMLEKIDDVRGILLALNNIGVIYHYENKEKAMEYYTKVKELSEAYGITHSAIFALTNIASIHYDNFNLEDSHKNFKRALEASQKIHALDRTYHLLYALTSVCLRMNQYVEAFGYYRQLKQMVEDNFLGINIVEYYESGLNLYKELGDFHQAEKYSKQIVEFHKERNNIYKNSAQLYIYMNEIRKSKEAIDPPLIQEIITFTKKMINKQHVIVSLCEIVQILYEKNNTSFKDSLLKEANEYITNETPDTLKGQYYYTTGITSKHENKYKFLTKSLHYAKKAMDNKLIANINIALGDHYLATNHNYNAAHHYLESVEIIKELLDQVPNELKIKYINANNFAKPFNKLKEIKCKLHGTIYRENVKNKDEIHCIKVLNQLLMTDEFNFFMKNKDFIEAISKEYLEKQSKNISSISDMITNVRGEAVANIKTVLHYLTGLTLATNGFIVMEEERQHVSVLASLNHRHINSAQSFILNRVRSMKEPILLNHRKNNKEHQLLQKPIKACLCIPIVRNQFNNMLGNQSTLVGYIYLETDKMVNNFDEAGLKKCQQLVNYLALLIEKNQLETSATIDKLTGTLTRKYLDDALQDVLAYAANTSNIFSIILYDLPARKKEFGHNELNKASVFSDLAATTICQFD